MGYVFTSIDAGSNTQAWGIDNAGNIVGGYWTNAALDAKNEFHLDEHGFYLSSGHISNADYFNPSSSTLASAVLGISSGGSWRVGEYSFFDGGDEIIPRAYIYENATNKYYNADYFSSFSFGSGAASALGSGLN